MMYNAYMKYFLSMLMFVFLLIGCSESHVCREDKEKQNNIFSEKYEKHNSVLVTEYHAWRKWLETHPQGTYEEFIINN